ncbi:hypothetical protein [Streptomyces sioyaensis]|uniref:hypothetical protein n=1 Tax=Streptomyces sioyaensis TaxID=67364 RepID=UPI003795BC2A
MTAQPETDPVTADSAELRRLLDVRTARVDGQLALLARRRWAGDPRFLTTVRSGP